MGRLLGAFRGGLLRHGENLRQRRRFRSETLDGTFTHAQVDPQTTTTARSGFFFYDSDVHFFARRGTRTMVVAKKNAHNSPPTQHPRSDDRD